MKYILSVCTVIALSACSMAPQQSAQRSNSIRIIKEQPNKSYAYEKKYNTKIEQVDYNSSIIAPELDPNSRQARKEKKQAYGNKFTKRITGKVSSTVSSKTNQVESRASGIINSTIDRGISSLFR